MHNENALVPAAESAPVKFQNADPVVRLRCRELLDAGVLMSHLARAAGVNPSFLSLYLHAEGNRYPGELLTKERKLMTYIERRELETLAGIPTIETAVSRQIEAAAKTVQRARLMGACLGRAGIGKTRGAARLAAQDETVMLIPASREEGSKESVRARLMKHCGIRGPQKRTSARARLMYSELTKRLRDTANLIVIDQAHMLTAPAIDFLCELWNATGSPQLWLGTEKLIEKLQRDEQWASRLSLVFPLGVAVTAETNDVRPVVEHQIKSRIESLDGEFARLRNLCERLALHGSFRRVETRLAMMLHLRQSRAATGKTWCELFEAAENFIREQPEEAS